MNNGNITTLSDRFILNNRVTKSNSLIETAYSLNLQEHRIVSTIISMTQPGDESFQLYRFTTKELADILGIKSKANGYIRDTIKNLQTKTFSVPKGKGTIDFVWFASCEYIPGEGIIELEISQKLKPYLLELKERFTSYHLRYVMQLTSSYSVRIYELLKQYQFMKHKSRVIELSKLREWLGFIDSDKNKYRQYGHFKAKVLKVCHEDINTHTDIRFDYEEIKRGRKVVAIKFTMSQKEIEKDEMNEPLLKQLNGLAKTFNYQLSKKTFDGLLKTATTIWGGNADKQLYKLVSYVHKQKNVRNYVGLMVHILEDKLEQAKAGIVVTIEDPSTKEILPEWFQKQKMEPEQVKLELEVEEKNPRDIEKEKERLKEDLASLKR